MGTLCKVTSECNIKIFQSMLTIKAFRIRLRQIKWNIQLKIALKKKLKNTMIVKCQSNLKIIYKGNKLYSSRGKRSKSFLNSLIWEWLESSQSKKNKICHFNRNISIKYKGLGLMVFLKMLDNSSLLQIVSITIISHLKMRNRLYSTKCTAR